MSPVETSAVIFACIFGGALIGIWLRSVLPAQHLDSDTKEVVKLGVGLVGTMAALLLGLLVASAKGSYDARGSELTQIAANAILLDRVLARYGPETGEVRGILKIAIAGAIEQFWGKRGGVDAQTNREVIFEKIEALVPRSDTQRTLQSQAESIAISLGQTRWLLFAQTGTAISAPFLVVVVFWLTMLFVSFGLFAPRNATAIAVLLVSALSVAGALFLILELDHPFSGLIQVSSAPLRNALLVLGK